MDFNSVNPKLTKLAELLKMSNPTPSHGYTISEAGPEIVTAPGVYFPSEKGEVIPLQSRAEGGPVSPNSSDTEKEKLGILRDIISQVKPRQGTESRQFGGPVSPDNKPSIMDQIEKTKYDIFKSAISALKPQKQQPVTGGENTPLQSRQYGGNVEPYGQIGQDILASLMKRLKGRLSNIPELPYNERTSAYGSRPGPSMLSSTSGDELYNRLKATSGFPGTAPPSLPTPPSLPGLPKPVTPSSYGIMPEAMKPSEGEALWQKGQGGSRAGVLDLTSPKITTTLVPGSVQTGTVTPTTPTPSSMPKMGLEGWGIKQEGNTYTLPGTEGTMTVGPQRWFENNKELKGYKPGAISGDELAKLRLFSRQYGGFVSPDLEELKKRKQWEIPGYPERRLEEVRNILGPSVLGVQPGFQKSYYEEHPEEKLMDEEAYRMKPLTDAIMKSIKDEETRLQGYGLGVRGETSRKGTPSQIPELMAGLGKIMPAGLAPIDVSKMGKMPGTPHLVQTEDGQYAWAYPPTTKTPTGSVLPAGISGKKPTIEGFEEWKRVPGNERKTYENYKQWETSLKEKEIIPSGLREFEVAEGIDLSKRGTPEYSKSYREFLGGKKEATRDPIEQKKLGTTLRKEFNSLQPVKDYRDIETRFNVMDKAVKESKTTKNFVAVDQALITIFNKMTDPQSVVRESEYLRTPQDLALWNRVKGKVSKMLAGGAGLTSDDRNALFSMAKQFQSAYESKFNQLRNEYRGYAVDYGLDPETVIKSELKKKGTEEESDMDKFWRK